MFTRSATVCYSCDLLSKTNWLFSNSSFTFDWHRIMSSFQTSVPSSIEYLVPSGVKLALNRTTRPHSSTNSLKCATLYDCYEYGLEIQANRSQTRHRGHEWTCLPANHRAPKKKKSRAFMYVGYEIFWLLFSCFEFYFLNLPYACCSNKLKFCSQTGTITNSLYGVSFQSILKQL